MHNWDLMGNQNIQAKEIYSIVLSTNCYNSAFYDCTLQVSTTAIKVNYPITSLLIKKCVNNNLLNLQEKMQLEQIISYLHELYGRKVIEGMTFDYCNPVSWKITGKKLMNHRWKYFLLLYIQSRKDFELPKAMFVLNVVPIQFFGTYSGALWWSLLFQQSLKRLKLAGSISRRRDMKQPKCRGLRCRFEMTAKLEKNGFRTSRQIRKVTQFSWKRGIIICQCLQRFLSVLLISEIFSNQDSNFQAICILSVESPFRRC